MLSIQDVNVEFVHDTESYVQCANGPGHCLHSAEQPKFQVIFKNMTDSVKRDQEIQKKVIDCRVGEKELLMLAAEALQQTDFILMKNFRSKKNQQST